MSTCITLKTREMLPVRYAIDINRNHLALKYYRLYREKSFGTYPPLFSRSLSYSDIMLHQNKTRQNLKKNCIIIYIYIKLYNTKKLPLISILLSSWLLIKLEVTQIRRNSYFLIICFENWRSQI